MTDIHVLGDGCAAMMLASRADELGDATLSIVRPDGAQLLGTTCLDFGPRQTFTLRPNRHVIHGPSGR